MQKLNWADSALLSEAVNAVKHLKEIEIFIFTHIELLFDNKNHPMTIGFLQILYR